MHAALDINNIYDIKIINKQPKLYNFIVAYNL